MILSRLFIAASLAGVCLCGFAPVLRAQSYAWANFAGQPGGAGTVDGTGAEARFYNPMGTAVDSSGNIYAAESGNHIIRKITPAGVVTTLAGKAGESGTADGTGSAARFQAPSGVAVDGSGNLYVADTSNFTIRKITPAGVVTTVAGAAGTGGGADGTGSAARFYSPYGITIDSAGNLYVTDTYAHTIRKITPGLVVTTLAGSPNSSGSANGTGSAARFNYPGGIAVDSSGNLYVADQSNHTIRKVTPAGAVSTVAGTALSTGSTDATGSAARFNYPGGIAVDSSGNLWVADSSNHTLRKVTTTGVVTTPAGTAGSSGSADGTGAAARFSSPHGIAVDGSGNFWVADAGNQTIRKMTPAGVVTTLAGAPGHLGTADGTGTAAAFKVPSGAAVDGSGNVYVADTSNHTIRKITPAGVVTTLAGTAGNSGSTDATGSAARFKTPYGVAADSSGNVYVADSGNHTIRKVTPAGAVSTVAGTAGSIGNINATGSAARFNFPQGVAVDGSGNLYVADTNNQLVRKITSGGVVTTLAGSGFPGYLDGTGTGAYFFSPSGIAVEGAGTVYVADNNNQVIRKVTPAGVVTTLAGTANTSEGTPDGTGADARFRNPMGVATDGEGNVYVADSNNSTVRKITPSGVVTTIGGTARVVGGAEGIGAAAQFSTPRGLAVTADGVVFLADTSNHRISQGMPLYPPVLALTTAADGLTSAGAVLHGSVNPRGLATTAIFQYGLDASYGSSASVTLSPNDGSSAQEVSSTLAGLTAGMAYHYRLSATNLVGTTVSADATFTSLTVQEEWRRTYFGSTENTGTAADGADPDGDGMTNVQEFTAGTSPQSAASVFKIGSVQVNGGVPTLNFPSVAGKTYRVEYKDNLLDGVWNVLQNNLSGTGGALQVNDSTGTAQSRRFYRAVVVP
ncbi:hypothetical protein [Prosthecobacter sp.]|uniref:hypothetical protein n=1 Tax=Prosthecobacter sp. TaxID=1965333 RepID=UPI003784B50B